MEYCPAAACRSFNFEEHLMRCCLLAALVAGAFLISADRASAQVAYPATVVTVAPYYPMVRTYSAPVVYSTYSTPVFISTRQWYVAAPGTVPEERLVPISGSVIYPPPLLQVGYTTYAPVYRGVRHGHRGW
jgi:hypothetical protein